MPQYKVKSASDVSGPSGRQLSPISEARGRWEYFFSPLNGMLVHRRITSPSITFPGTHLYTWVERGTVRVKCLQQSLTSAGHTAQTSRWPKDKSIYETQHNVPGQGSDPGNSIRRQARHKANVPTQIQSYNVFFFIIFNRLYAHAKEFMSALIAAWRPRP